jgi:hypothetical protein
MADLTSNQLCNICCIHYNAGLRCCALGSALEGGRLFAKDGRSAWIVAPAATQVSRIWTSRNDAVTTAQASAACGDWFIPSKTDLIYGFDCRSFWDSFSVARYWTNTEYSATYPWNLCFNNGCYYSFPGKTTVLCVRAFRRVLY